MRIIWIAALITVTLAAGCSNRGSAETRTPRQGTLPDRGAIVYSWDAVGFWSIETSEVRGRQPGRSSPMTETDHRQVIDIAADGRAVVVDDFHDDGRAGTYVRWRPRDLVTTVLLRHDPAGAVALCGSRAVVYATEAGIAIRRRGEPARVVAGDENPALLRCSHSGERIAALDEDGTLMLGSAAGLTPAAGTMRFSAVEWSPDGSRLAACTRDGDVVTLSPRGTPGPKVGDSDSQCEVAWAPDGRHIAFTAAGRVVTACTCGGSPAVVMGAVQANTPLWSPSGTAIAYGELLSGVRAVEIATGRVVVVVADGVPVAWLSPRAARRAAALADPYPCC